MVVSVPIISIFSHLVSQDLIKVLKLFDLKIVTNASNYDLALFTENMNVTFFQDLIQDYKMHVRANESIIKYSLPFWCYKCEAEVFLKTLLWNFKSLSLKFMVYTVCCTNMHLSEKIRCTFAPINF